MLDVLFDGVVSNLKDRPFNLEFAITENCNSRCVMCNRWKTSSKNELSIFEIHKIFTSYRGFKIIGITGGEPSLRNDLSSVIKYSLIDTQPKLKRIFITSNGFLWRQLYRQVKDILDYLDYVNKKLRLAILISLDGPRPVHNMIRGLPYAYDRAITCLDNMSKLRQSYDFILRVVATYSPFNFQVYDEVLKEIKTVTTNFDLESRVCVVWYGNLFDSVDQKHPFAYLKELPNWAPRINEVIGIHHSGLINAQKTFYDIAKCFVKAPNHQVIPCGGARIRYFMNAHGQVFPCVIWDKMIGDLREKNYDFQKIIESERRKRIRQEVVEEKCPICFLDCELIPSMMANPLKIFCKKYMG